MTRLSYPKLPHVKLGLWSIRQKINFALEIDTSEISMWGDEENTYIDFQTDLTQEQIDKINLIVNDPNAQTADVNLQLVNNTYIMRDIWEWRDQIAAESGIDFSVWFRSSGTFGSNIMDEIVIIPTDPTHTMTRLLTKQQKSALEAAIISGNRWE